MQTNFDETIRQIINEELDKRDTQTHLVPVAKFCSDHDLNRVTLWRQEKSGKLKVTRIGKKVFVDPGQFVK